MLLVDDLAAGGTKNLRHTPRGLVTLFLFIFQSFGLFNSLTVSEQFWMTNSKVRIKFSNQQVYWYFYIVGWGKTGPAHSFPPPKCFDLPIYHLVFWLNVTPQFWMTYSKERIKFLNQQVYWYFYIVGWGKTGFTHSPPLPPIKCFDVSFYLSVFWIILLFHCIFTLMNDLFQWEYQVFKPTSLFVIVGWGKTGPAHSFPPPKSFDLSIDQLVFRFMLLFHCILTLMKIYSKERIKFSNQTFNLYCYIVGWGKTGPAHSFPPPPPPPLQNVLIFLFIFQSFSLCFSFTVSEDT